MNKIGFIEYFSIDYTHNPLVYKRAYKIQIIFFLEKL